ncbi:hypothetical protein [Treponema denticola]|uniref:hypothetical protein n=1 Tax=Treponema denticola TaxID=158 RepID=UPI0021033EF3|nr:hypothetical protein [Treponema denticola]UTY25297.1 hypothetical protein E4N77_00385 [Treponema denticola]
MKEKKSKDAKKRPQTLCKIALISVILVLIAAAAGIFGVVRYNDNRRLDVAYYGISESITNAISSVLESPDNAILKKNYSQIRTVRLTEKDIRDVKRIAQKYDLLFTLNGRFASDAAQEAAPIPESVYNLFPASVRNAGKVNNTYKMLPLLLDHYELACYRTYRNEAALALPETFAGLESYLQTIKAYADYPLICAGKTDATLTAFVSAITESLAGSEGYTDLIKAAASTNGLSGLLDVPLGNGISFSSVLGTIKRWQNEGLIHPHWYNVTEKDIENYMEEHRLGAIFMPLSEHRAKPLILIKYYDAVQFPQGNTARHALIAPAIVGMAFKNNASQISMLEQLAHTDVQTLLSQNTKLAPASSRAEAHDVQADDVRFWAASCTDGPIQELGQAAFATQAQIAALAEEIRAYMKNAD